MKKHSATTILSLLCLLLVHPFFSLAQVTIGEGVPPDPSALLELRGNNWGFLGPRVELRSRIDPAPVTDPITGLLVYNLKNTDLPDKKNNVYANKYYYWAENQWMEFVNTLELNDTIRKIITKMEIPGVALFKLNGKDNLHIDHPQITGCKNFLAGKAIGSKQNVPLSQVVNFSQGAVTLNQTNSEISFKPGVYTILFVYEFFPLTVSPPSVPPANCTISSYFMDFPIPERIVIGEDRARIHSTCYHRDKIYSNHGGYISYATALIDETGDGIIKWTVSLGVGQSGNCTAINNGVVPTGFGLANDGTFLYICKQGEIK